MENSEKKDTKKKSKKRIFGVLILILLIGGIYVTYSIWEDANYFVTENAKVNTKLASIVATAPGKLIEYNVEQGSMVKEDDIIGKIENSAYLKSPITGQVVKSNVDLNQMITPQAVIAVVADIDDIYIAANIEETGITKIAKDQSVTVYLDAYPGKSFKGHVSQVDMITQNALNGNPMSFSTSGTYTKVTQLIPIRVKIDEYVKLDGIIGTNAKIKVKIK
jgi:multidrug resistance efflux pump